MGVEVTLLTQPDCTLCDHAKEVLARVSGEHPLEVRELELASDEGTRLAEAGGVMFAPGVFIDGQPFSYGRLSERKLRKALVRHSA